MRRRPARKTLPTPRDNWLTRHHQAVLWMLVGASIAIRVTYFRQLNSTPLIEMQRWRQTDMHYYDAWARDIARGDWLSASVRVPMHRWHQEIAARYFAAHQADFAELRSQATRSDVHIESDELLWSRWMQVPQFYQDPLYAYLVALTYRLVGADVRYVFVWQLGLGVLTNVLIFQLSRRYFGDLVAACAATLAVLYGPLMFYQSMLLRDSTIVFAGLALVWLADRAVITGRVAWCAGLGLAIGLSVLLKSTFLLMAVGIATAIIVRFRRRPRQLLLSTAALATGLGIAFTPLVARNVAVGVRPFSMASSGPLTFVASNEVDYLPEVGFGINAPVLTRFLGETDGTWRPAVAEALSSHSTISYASLLWRKWGCVWHWYEIPNNENFYYMRMQVPVLTALPVTFWLCAPLALMGLVLAGRRYRDIWPLYLLVLASLAPLVLFYVLSRFRIALAAALIPFGAFALVHAVQLLRTRRPLAALVVAALLIVGSWTSRPLASHQLLVRMADWILPYSAYYQSRVYDALDAKEWAKAGAEYLEFFRFEPSVAQILASGDPALARELADMHLECAKILNMSGQASLARDQMEQADRLLRLNVVRLQPDTTTR